MIWLAYMAIPALLIYFVRRRLELPFPWMFWMFGAFIVGCGFTHLMEVVTYAVAVYRLSALVKVAAALISLATVISLIRIAPRALALRTPEKWDAKDETGLRHDKSVKNVEFYRDIKPILDRSCVACHTGKSDKPAGNLVLDDDKTMGITYVGNVSGTYFRLAADREGKFGHKPIIGAWWSACTTTTPAWTWTA